MNDRERWAAEIRRARARRGWTQTELAALLVARAAAGNRLIKVRQADVSSWEQERRTPPEWVRADLIRVLDIDPRAVAPEWVRPLLKAA